MARSSLILLVVGAVAIVALAALVQFVPTTKSGGASEAASSPAACNNGFHVTAVAESAPGAISYTCTADNTAEAASTPAACATHFVVNQVAESAAGVISYNCLQLGYGDLTGHVGTANETASSPAACGAGESMYQVAESAAGVLTPTCQDTVNQAFTSSAGTCTISSASASASGNGLTYTTLATNFEHDVRVTLDFEVQTPSVTASVNTQFVIIYGTGTAPTCAATSGLGMAVGNTYTWKSPTLATATAEQTKFSDTVVINGLAASTAYWFELKVTDSSSASWIYSLPQLSVTES